jgi:methylated-DNA-[protein]-cysteine S-methyltransferase
MTTIPDTLYWHEIDSAVGKLLLAGDGENLIHINFQSGPRPVRPKDSWIADPAPLRTAIAQLEEYFAGERRRFDLPLAARGTEFQRRVWRALTEIPYGKTLSYGELARRIAQPSASRAVGLANGANPLPIIVPCHRVIGADGSLTGFGGGLPVKRKLLALEAMTAGESGPQAALFGPVPAPTP